MAATALGPPASLTAAATRFGLVTPCLLTFDHLRLSITNDMSFNHTMISPAHKAPIYQGK
jgi:hypothetical protein